jgi:hypothetical protein
MGNIWSEVVSILKAPLVSTLDTKTLFLLVGLVLVMIAAWVMILGHIRVAAQEII